MVLSSYCFYFLQQTVDDCGLFSFPFFPSFSLFPSSLRNFFLQMEVSSVAKRHYEEHLEQNRPGHVFDDIFICAMTQVCPSFAIFFFLLRPFFLSQMLIFPLVLCAFNFRNRFFVSFIMASLSSFRFLDPFKALPGFFFLPFSSFFFFFLLSSFFSLSWSIYFNPLTLCSFF